MADFRNFDPVGDGTPTPNVTSTFQFGGDWPGSNDNYLRISGDPNSATVASSGEFSRIYMPYAGNLVGISWDSANDVTRQMQVLINGTAATGFSFTVDATKTSTPTPVAFTAGDYIEVRGNSAVGAGDPSDVTVHVWTRSLVSDIELSQDASLTVPQITGVPMAMFIGDSGTKMYLLDSTTGTGLIHQYTLSTAYSLGGASYAGLSLDTNIYAPSGVTSFSISDDGSTLVVVTQGPTDTAYEWTLSTAWNISTGSSTGTSFVVNTQDTTALGLSFGSSGSRMYMTGSTNDMVYQYDLTTPFDISTASFSSNSVSTTAGSPRQTTWNTAGTTMYLVNPSDSKVHIYTFSTPWELDTLTSTSSIGLPGNNLTPRGVYLSPDGTTLFTTEDDGPNVYQYSFNS